MYANCFSYTMRLNGEQWIKMQKSPASLICTAHAQIYHDTKVCNQKYADESSANYYNKLFLQFTNNITNLNVHIYLHTHH